MAGMTYPEKWSQGEKTGPEPLGWGCPGTGITAR